MVEEYIESIIIRRDNIHLPKGNLPTFNDDQCDKEFEFEGTIVLRQIVKNVQNVMHNRHNYVFEIKEINKIQEED
ncbi:unnamed protein product [marine sediment metagenome]|uniref:Uncharacterized protein n=1 Tax=marine sediment metagenome TaxID=412755 RepID=X1BZA7_9ZZZZ